MVSLLSEFCCWNLVIGLVLFGSSCRPHILKLEYQFLKSKEGLKNCVKYEREREREMTFQSFAKLELPLFRGLFLHCLLYCNSREGGWEPFKAFTLSDMASSNNAFRLICVKKFTVQVHVYLSVTTIYQQRTVKWYSRVYIFHFPSSITNLCFPSTNNR